MKKLLFFLSFFAIVSAKSQVQIGFMNQTSSVTYATWNPSDKSVLITLSGGNLVAQSTSGASEYLVRSTVSKSTGKWYWEITFVRNTPTDPNFVPCGISLVSESVNSWPGATAGSCLASNGLFYQNGVPGTLYGGLTDGDVIGMALDLTGGSETIKFYKNNVLLATETIPAGTYFASTGTYQTLGTTTANFGATAFVYGPPVGYNAGLY